MPSRRKLRAKFRTVDFVIFRKLDMAMLATLVVVA